MTGTTEPTPINQPLSSRLQLLHDECRRRLLTNPAFKARRRGVFVDCCCPHPAHSDQRPSAYIHERGWQCRVCGRGGGVLDLAALLGVPTR